MAATVRERRSRELERKEAACSRTDTVDTRPAFSAMAGYGRHGFCQARRPRPTGSLGVSPLRVADKDVSRFDLLRDARRSVERPHRYLIGRSAGRSQFPEPRSRARSHGRISGMGSLGNARATYEVALRTNRRLAANGRTLLSKYARCAIFEGLPSDIEPGVRRRFGRAQVSTRLRAEWRRGGLIADKREERARFRF
jgi:hypothetical protein